MSPAWVISSHVAIGVTPNLCLTSRFKPCRQNSTCSFCGRPPLVRPAVRAESLNVLSDRLSFLLFYGGESNRGHFQIAVRETMQEPSFEVIPGFDTPGLEMFEPLEGNSLEGAEE